MGHRDGLSEAAVALIATQFKWYNVDNSGVVDFRQYLAVAEAVDSCFQTNYAPTREERKAIFAEVLTAYGGSEVRATGPPHGLTLRTERFHSQRLSSLLRE